jgi:uncharacterized membrane protein
MTKLTSIIRNERFFVLTAILLWLVYTMTISVIRYKSLDFKLMDQGTYYYIIEHLRNYGSWYDLSTDFAHRLGIHFSVILALFVPFHYISASPLTMVFIQLLVGSIGAYGIYLITSRVFNTSEDHIIRKIMPVVYLGFHPFLRSMLYDFDVSRLAPTFIIFFLYYTLFNRKILLSMIFGLLLCLTRETLPLVIAGTGVYLLLTEKNKRTGMLYLLSGLGLFFIITLIIMPSIMSNNPMASRLSGESLVYLNSRFAYLLGNSTSEKISFALHHPGIILKNFFIIPWFKWPTFFGMFLLLFLLPFFDIKKNVILIFTLGIYYLSNAEVTFLYKHQYFAEIFPVIFISAISGLKHVLSIWKTRRKLILRFFIYGQILIISVSAVWMTSYYAGKYRDALKFTDEINCVINDVAKINAMPKDETALFLHNRLFLYYDWKRYMTYFAYFDTAYKIYSDIPSIKKMYFITLNEPEFGDTVIEQYNTNIEKAKKAGFKKTYTYKNFIVFEKIVTR